MTETVTGWWRCQQCPAREFDVWGPPGTRLMTEQELRQHFQFPEAVGAHEPPVCPRHVLTRQGFPGRSAAMLFSGVTLAAGAAGILAGWSGSWWAWLLLTLLVLPAATWQAWWGAPSTPDYRRVARALRGHVEEGLVRDGFRSQLDALEQEFVRTLEVAGDLGELG
jgi:hypothetical protein